MLIDLLQESSSRLIITDLCQLERNSIGSVSRFSELLVRFLDNANDSVPILSSGNTVGDSDNEDRFGETTGSSGTEDEGLEDLLVERGSEGSETGEFDLGDESESSLLRGDVLLEFPSE